MGECKGLRRWKKKGNRNEKNRKLRRFDAGDGLSQGRSCGGELVGGGLASAELELK